MNKFLYIIALLGLFIHNPLLDGSAFASTPIILADPGFAYDEFYQLNYSYLKLSVYLQDAREVSIVRGAVTHPYGARDFELELASSDIVKDASVSSFSDHINFEVQLAATIPNELTLLFSLRPVVGGENVRPNIWTQRPGSFQGSYPYQVFWLYFEAFSFAGDKVKFECLTDPVTISWDYSFVNIYLTTKDFPDDVVSVSFTYLNGVSYYPPRELIKYDINYFRYDGFSQIFKEVNDVVLLVKLKNGEIYKISVPDMPPKFTLTPTVGMAEWRIYD